MAVRRFGAKRGPWVVAVVLTVLLAACATLKNSDELPPPSASSGASGGGQAGEPSPGGTAGAVGQGGVASGGATLLGGEAGTGSAPITCGEPDVDAGGDDGMEGTGGYGPGPDGCSLPFDPLAYATYYFCQCPPGAPVCYDGDDASVGIQPNQPMRSFARAMQKFATMPGGTTLAFCRGGLFQASALPANPNCTAKKPCIIRDYVPLWNDPRQPIIDGGNDAAFRIPIGAGYQLINLRLTGQSAGVVVDSGASDVTLCGLEIEELSAGVQLSSGSGVAARVVLRDSTIRGSEQSAVAIEPGGCESCAIEHNLLEDNGLSLRESDAHAAIRVESQQASSSLHIRNNVLRTTSVSGGNRCLASAITVRGASQGLRIEDNVIEELGVAGALDPACLGIEIDGVSNGAGVSRNRLFNRGRAAVSIGGSCDGCRIDNNLIAQKAPYAVTAMELGGATEGLRILNNTFYVSSASTADGSMGFAFAPGGLASCAVLANNVSLYRGTGARFTCVTGAARIAQSFAFVDNNACYFPASPSGRWSEGTLSEWSQSSGFDQHSLELDPQLVEQAGVNFLSPAVDSPMLDAGSTLYRALGDIDGKPRGTPPDMGAIER